MSRLKKAPADNNVLRWCLAGQNDLETETGVIANALSWPATRNARFRQP